MKKIKKNWIVSGLLFVFCALSMAFGLTLTNSAGFASADQQPWEISEQAMRDFLSKIQSYNYVMETDNVTVNVYSSDLVYYTYDEPIAVPGVETRYVGYAVMTFKNDNNADETFFGYIGENEMEYTCFIADGKAVDRIENVQVLTNLPVRIFNYWLAEQLIPYDEPFGEIFYNDTATPLKVSSTDERVTESLKLFNQKSSGGMGGASVDKVYMEFRYDGASLVSVKLTGETAVQDENEQVTYQYLDGYDVVVTFGNAENNAIADAWINDAEKELPEAREDWKGDITHLNALFLNGYEKKAVPFPSCYATYALQIDYEYINQHNVFRAYDCHATEEGMQEYINLLLKKGFTAVQKDGKTVYRILLRPERHAYAEIYLEYNNGVVLEARRYYEVETYSSMSKVNRKITECGYPTFGNLPDGAEFVSSYDNADSYTESWAGLFDFSTLLYVTIEGDENFENYISNYISTSLADYTMIASDDEDEEYNEVKEAIVEKLGAEPKLDAPGDGNTYWSKEDRSGVKTFRYLKQGTTYTLLFKAQRYVQNKQIKESLAKYNFPAFSDDLLSKITSSRDMREYNRILHNKDYQMDLNIKLKFASEDEIDAYLDPYFTNLKDNEDFVDVQQKRVSMDRDYTLRKSIDGTVFVIGITRQGANDVEIEFRVDSTSKDIWNKYDSVTDADVLEFFGEAEAVGKALAVHTGDAVVTFNHVAVKEIWDGQEAIFSFDMSDDIEGVNIDGAVKVVNISMTGFTAGKATVEIPFANEIPQGKIVKVYYVDEDGNKTQMKTRYEDETVIFETTHCSQFVIAIEDAPLSAGAIAGIVIGGVASLGLIGFCIYEFIFKKKKQSV